MWTIYKLISKEDENTIYVGKTSGELRERLWEHKADANRFNGETPKQRWILDHYGSLEIVAITTVDKEPESAHTEKAEIIKYITQGYNVLNKALRGIIVESYQTQYRKCGKPSCSTCAHGKGHGPYVYAYWWENGKLRNRYIGKANATIKL